jgi:hypothetical protein
VTAERLDNLPPIRPSQKPAPPISDPMQFLQHHFESLDKTASVHAPKARRLIQRCLLMHLGASILVVLAVFLRFSERAHPNIRYLIDAIAITDVAVLAVAFYLLKSRGLSYEKWLHTRAESEICRSFLATWQIRRQARVGHQPHPALPGLEQVFASLRLLRQLDDSPKPDFELTRSHYESDRLMDQLNYFNKHHELAVARYKKRKIWMRLCTIIAIISSLMVLLLCFDDHHLDGIKTMFEFFGIVLPLATTSIGLMLLTDESSRRMLRYREMIDTLQYFQPRIRSCRTWVALAHLATQLEAALLQEILEWQSFVRHTEDVG